MRSYEDEAQCDIHLSPSPLLKHYPRADLAVEVDTYRVTRQSAGGETVTDTGTSTVVWMQEGAQWKMHIDMWNTSPPAPDRGRGRVRPRSSPLDHGRACSCLCAVRCTSTLFLPGEPRRLPIALPWPSDREHVAAGQAGRDGHDV